MKASKVKKYYPVKRSRGGVCGSTVGKSLCEMQAQCQYISGRKKKGSKPSRKGYCKSRPMAEREVNRRISGLFAGQYQ
jgi:hypothetical protein